MGQFLRLVAKAIILVAVVTPTVAQASDNPLPDRMAIITIKGLETTNLHERDWFVHLSRGDNQFINPATYPKYPNPANIQPGILTKITDHISNGEFSFYLNNASACVKVPALHIVYGYEPTGLCCVTDDHGTISYANMTQFECVTKNNDCYTSSPPVLSRTWQAGLPCTGMNFDPHQACDCSTHGVCCDATSGDCISHRMTQRDCIINEDGVWYGYPPGLGPDHCEQAAICTNPLTPTTCGAAGEEPLIPTTAFPPAWNTGQPSDFWPASDMWWIRAEFAFCSPGGSESDGMIDISYVDSFSHPLSVKVYGSDQAPTFTGSPIGTLSPTCMVKQKIINSLWSHDGFKTADGQYHSGAKHSPVNNSACSQPPVWICSGGINNCKTSPTLWQNPSPNSDPDWNPRDHHGDFMRVMMPDKLYNRWIAEDSNCGSVFNTNPKVAVLPGYEDAMERLYSTCPVIEGDGAGGVIFIGGNAAALCNAQNYYNNTDHDHSFCGGVTCSTHGDYPSSDTDFYGTWARVGRTESCLDCLTGEYAYWFELYKHNPNDLSRKSFLQSDPPAAGYWHPNETLKIPYNGSSGGSVDEINACLYARLAAADIGEHGSKLPAMSWEGAEGDANTVAKKYLGSVVRDIAATLGHGQLGANAGIGYAFTPTGACCVGTSCSVTTEADCGGTYLGDGTDCSGDPCGGGGLEHGHPSNDGFFWLKGTQMVGQGHSAYLPVGVPNEHGKPTDWTNVTWTSGSTDCCCASLPGGQWDESDLFGHDTYYAYGGLPTDLATGQMVFLNNWFSDLALGACCSTSGWCLPMTEAKCTEIKGTFYGYNTTCSETDCSTTPTDHTMKPWSQTYEAMYSELGSEVYTSSFSDFWQRSDGKGPQIPSNHYKYMKYEFELGTMTLGDITDHSGLGTHGDRKVDVADLLHMLEAWGPEGITDLNGDHIVNRDDLIVLLNNWAP